MALIWNAAAGIVRSNGNLTITNSATFSAASTAALSGKVYLEVTFDVINATPTAWPQTGLVGQTWQGSGHSIVDADAWGIYNPGGFVDLGSNGADVGTVKATALAAGDVLCYAIDIPNKRGWMRINNGSWNGAVANPATGTGYFDFSGIGTSFSVGNLFGNNIGNQVTLNAGATAFAFTPPSGFTGPDTVTTDNGAVANTLAALTMASAGKVKVQAAAGPVLAALAGAAAGAVKVQGAAGAALAGLAMTAAGGVKVSASLSATLGDLTMSAGAGGVASAASSSLLGDLAMISTGAAKVQGAVATTLDALAMAGGNLGGVRGSSAVTLGGLSMSATVTRLWAVAERAAATWTAVPAGSGVWGRVAINPATWVKA